MASGDLTTLADAKAWLNISTSNDDALLTRLVTACSAFIRSYIGRDLTSQSYTERRNGTGGMVLVMKNKPITAVASVTIDGTAIAASSDNAVLQAGYGFDDTKVWLNGYTFTRAIGNVVVTYTAGYTALPYDVSQACIELVALRYRERDRIGETSKNMQGMVVAYNTKDLTAQIRTALDQYRQVAVL